jgi:hypothetical protein
MQKDALFISILLEKEHLARLFSENKIATTGSEMLKVPLLAR